MGNSPALLALRSDKYIPHSVVLITGATKGIGKELALRYARRGCSLVLAARGEKALQAAKAECLAAGAGGCLAVPTDVTKEAACAHLISEAVREFGRLDVLVLNAGVSAHFPFSEFADMEIFRRLLDVNFFGYGFFEALRMECGDQVDVTICCPPSVKTGMRDGNAFAEAEKQLRQLQTNSGSAADGDNNEAKPSSSNSSSSSSSDKRSSNSLKETEGEDAQAANKMDKKETDEMKEEADSRMPVDVCVDYILKAADKRARKAMFPLYSYLAVYVRPILPGIVDPFIKRAAKL
ncbi:hypothetical protein, conserved [Eimeria tenella]|uniref:Oxidoreductase n=1 Tax=Eimeria tenella TaxID=5802 RepID=U6KNV0_EIMTE|nr:hypothetical protein, conserved [Eimeria tenella]CDJ37133.1 hypothetical protein, conserved [Eimeria tenella]|eukprot:XP_013227971.1 hypothetical protein, conserved [Eimeria tenella]